MTIEEAEDPVLRPLRRLRVHEPDPARAERVRARCLATLAARRRNVEGSTRGRFATFALESALVAGFCVSYLMAVIRDVLQLHGIR